MSENLDSIEIIINPWVKYAGWPTFWFGLFFFCHQAIIMPYAGMYYPEFMEVKWLGFNPPNLKKWLPGAQLFASIMALSFCMWLVCIIARKKWLNPLYFVSASIMMHSTILALHFWTDASHHFLGEFLNFQQTGKFLYASSWHAINFIFVAWFFALVWTCLQEIGGLKGIRLSLSFAISIGMSGTLVAILYKIFNLTVSQ